MRFRLFDRIRRSREPEAVRDAAVTDPGRRSGRHRFGNAVDRARRAAGPSANGDWRSYGRGQPGWRTQPGVWNARAGDRTALADGAPQAGTDPVLPWGAARTPDGRVPPGAAPADRRGRLSGAEGPPVWAHRDTSTGGGAEYRSLLRWPAPDGAALGRTEPGAAGRHGAERDAAARGAAPPGAAGRHGTEPGAAGHSAMGSDGAVPDRADRPGEVGPPDGRGGGPDGTYPWRLGPAATRVGYAPPADAARTELSRRDVAPWAARPGGARARVRRAPGGSEPFTSPVRDKPPASPAARNDARRGVRNAPARDARSRRPWYEVANPGGAAASLRRPTAERARPQPQARPDARQAGRDRYVAPHRAEEPYRGDGRRHCGSLEQVLHRQWDAAAPPPAEIVRAIDRLAELPTALKDKLAARLDGIFVGPGGVPDLDDMQHLRGVPLPAGRATWDICAGAYGGRKIIVGSRPSPTPDVMCHEIGHAVDDTGSSGEWLSDQAEFRRLYVQCVPHLVSDFHRQPSGLGRREFFADAFAAIASRQRPALVDMLGGDTRTALNVMLYFNRRFGI